MAQNPFQNFMVRFRAGESVFQEGDAGSTMFIVQSGQVRLSRDAGGNRQPVGVMEKGDFFGEMSILEGLPRTASADAVEDSELIEINSMGQNIDEKQSMIDSQIVEIQKLNSTLEDREALINQQLEEVKKVNTLMRQERQKIKSLLLDLLNVILQRTPSTNSNQ